MYRLKSLQSLGVMLFAATITCCMPASAQNAENRIGSQAASRLNRDIDRELTRALRRVGFSGRMESTLEQRLGRSINPELANLGRLLWFDVTGGLHGDNTCGGCHSPTNGMGDTQSIAIGIQNNNLVGPHRGGSRNQRRTPTAANTAFYPKLMWNGRFSAPSGDPFNNSLGFLFPPPEAATKFPPNDPVITHLLIAQAHIPPTEMVEVAGFTGTAGTVGPRFDVFDDGKGTVVPLPDSSGFRNEPIRQAVLDRLNDSNSYRTLFSHLFPSVAAGGNIDFTMFGRAITEFEFTLVFADAPIDQFARGQTEAMNLAQKRGALLFFGKAGCVACHAVSGQSNEMFSDFEMHVAGVPQIAPYFGFGEGNVIFDGLGEDEDFGLEQITGDSGDRYKFRTSPLRNVALQPAFFHNGAFTKLKDAIRYHLDASDYARTYYAGTAGVDHDLRYRLGPIEPVLARIDARLVDLPHLSPEEFESLVSFVADALLDSRAQKQNLCKLIPASVPSGSRLMRYEACPPPK
jgi:cytochrome c peroxidase